MAENLILQEVTISVDDWSWDEDFGAYAAIIAKAFSLTAGETYRIVCNGASNEASTAHDISEAIGMNMIAVGDLRILELPPNDGRYILGDNGTHNVFLLTSLPQSNPPGNYTFSVYHVVEDEEPEEPDVPEEPETPEGIVLKDRNGKDVAYYGIETVTFDTTTEGKQQVYTKGVAVENLEIVPDFSGGDMPINIPDGTLVKSAVIKKPEMLVPEYVAKDANIAGIEGIHKGGADGIYLTVTDTPAAGESRFFMFKKKMYWIVTDTTNSVFRIYRYEDGVYTEVASIASGGKFTNLVYTTIAEYNGLVHFFGSTGSYSKAHVTWDGANTFITLNDLPDYSENSLNNNVVVLNGELYTTLGSKIIYKWNETTDTWTQFATGKTRGIILHNDTFYSLYLGKLYEIVNGTATEVHALEKTDYVFSNGDAVAVVGDWVYIFYSAQSKFAKFNIVTKEQIFIGAIPGVLSNGKLWYVDGRFIYARSVAGYVTVHGVIE